MTERNNKINKVLNDIGDRLYDYIKYRVPNIEDAEDVYQDVLYQFTNGFDSIISFERVLGWLFTVSRNKITDLYRKNRTIPNDENVEMQAVIDELTINPQDESERLFLENELKKAIQALPQKQREIFIQNEIENRSFREIADETKESINTLLARKRYAVQTLRKQLISSYQEILEKTQ